MVYLISDLNRFPFGQYIYTRENRNIPYQLLASRGFENKVISKFQTVLLIENKNFDHDSTHFTENGKCIKKPHF